MHLLFMCLLGARRQGVRAYAFIVHHLCEGNLALTGLRYIVYH